MSTGGQDEENQVPEVERYCTERGYSVVKRYSLHDASAYHGEQDEAQREALADASAGLFGLLFCSDCGGPMYRTKSTGPAYYRCMANPEGHPRSASKSSPFSLTHRFSDSRRSHRSGRSHRLHRQDHDRRCHANREDHRRQIAQWRHQIQAR